MIQYIAPLTIGSDQQFNIIFDTGSTDLFLPAAGAGPHNTVQADPAITPYNGGGMQCTEAYGGRNQGIVGQIYDAPYSLAGSNADASSTFCLVSEEGSFNSPADGILGLGFCNGGSVATQTGNCPLAALGWTSFGVFILVFLKSSLPRVLNSSAGVYLSSDDLGGGGFITPNGVDEGLYQSDFTFGTGTQMKGYWIKF